MINLTQHNATPEQEEQGLRNVDNQEHLRMLLTIPEGAIQSEESVLRGFVESKAMEIVSTFVLPAKADQIRRFVADGVLFHGVSSLLNAYADAGRVDVLVGGAPLLVDALIRRCREVGAVPHYALYAMVSEDVQQPDGSLKRVSVYQHIRFIKAVR